MTNLKAAIMTLAFRRERGQTLAEYSIILTVVGVGVVVAALFFFSAQVGDLFDAMTPCLSGGC
jgi:Flp pilus assembly pilin Flp